MKTLEEEIWKDIEGYEGYYQVSNMGQVRGLDRVVPQRWGHAKIKGKIKSIHLDAYGYPAVHLAKDNTNKARTVHRLVAIAFCSGRMDGLVVNHKDADRTNNKASNLEWVTVQENVVHSFRMGRKLPSGQNAPLSKLMNADARMIRELYTKGLPRKRLALIFEVSVYTIGRVVTGEHYKEATEKHPNHDKRVQEILTQFKAHNK